MISEVLKMWLYEKKNDEIGIYTIEAQKEKLMQYRKAILENRKGDDLFYSLITGDKHTIHKFQETDKIDIRSLEYDNDSNFSVLRPMQGESEEMKSIILQSYIEGMFDSLESKRVVKRYPASYCLDWVYERKWIETDMYYFLTPEQHQMIGRNSIADVYAIKHMLNLPRNLYLLQLLQTGQFEKLSSENIQEQLQLFDIHYLKRLNIEDLEEMIASRIITESIDDINERIEASSKILVQKLGMK